MMNILKKMSMDIMYVLKIIMGDVPDNVDFSTIITGSSLMVLGIILMYVLTHMSAF